MSENIMGGGPGAQISGGVGADLTQPGTWYIRLYYYRLIAFHTFERAELIQEYKLEVKPQTVPTAPGDVVVPPAEPLPPTSSIVLKTFEVGAHQTQTEVERSVGLRPVNYTIEQLTFTVRGPVSAFDASSPYFVAGLGYVVGKDVLVNSGGLLTLPFRTSPSIQALTWQLEAVYSENSTADDKKTVGTTGRFSIAASQ